MSRSRYHQQLIGGLLGMLLLAVPTLSQAQAILVGSVYRIGLQTTTKALTEISNTSVRSSNGQSGPRMAFVRDNHRQLALDIARGNGEHLATAAWLYQLPNDELANHLKPHLRLLLSDGDQAAALTEKVLLSHTTEPSTHKTD